MWFGATWKWLGCKQVSRELDSERPVAGGRRGLEAEVGAKAPRGFWLSLLCQRGAEKMSPRSVSALSCF